MSDDRKHLEYMTLALEYARKCEPTPTAFCVGAVLVEGSSHTVIATGYSRELPGNTHAEQNCITKLLSSESGPITVAAGEIAMYSLYTTMEPCSERLSGNIPCTNSIIQYNESEERKLKGLGRIEALYVGVKEPSDFIKKNIGEEKLTASGLGYVHISGLEKEILEVARRGHHNAD